MKEKLSTACAYCGSALLSKGNKTRDHIPPKSWFTPNEKERYQAITIPSCKKCNNGASGKDENAKHFLNMCVLQMQRETPDQVQLQRKTLKKNARLRRPLENAESIVVQDTITGGYTFEKRISIDDELPLDTKDVLKRIARGLHWHHFQERLNADGYNVAFLAGVDLLKSQEVRLKQKQALKHVLDLQKLCKKVDLLPDVFTYWIGKADDHKDASLFFMLYRKAVLIGVCASPDPDIKIKNAVN